MRYFFICFWLMFSFASYSQQHQTIRLCDEDTLKLDVNKEGNVYWYFKSKNNQAYELISEESMLEMKSMTGKLFSAVALDSCTVILSDTLQIAHQNIEDITSGKRILELSGEKVLGDSLTIQLMFPELITSDPENPEKIELIVVHPRDSTIIRDSLSINTYNSEIPFSIKYMDFKTDSAGQIKYLIPLAERITYETCMPLIRHYSAYNVEEENVIFKLSPTNISNNHLVFFWNNNNDTINLGAQQDIRIGLFNLDKLESEPLDVFVGLKAKDSLLYKGNISLFKGEVPSLARREVYSFSSGDNTVNWPDYIPSGTYEFQFQAFDKLTGELVSNTSYEIILINPEENNIDLKAQVMGNYKFPFRTHKHGFEIEIINSSRIRWENLKLNRQLIYTKTSYNGEEEQVEENEILTNFSFVDPHSRITFIEPEVRGIYSSHTYVYQLIDSYSDEIIAVDTLEWPTNIVNSFGFATREDPVLTIDTVKTYYPSNYFRENEAVKAGDEDTVDVRLYGFLIDPYKKINSINELGPLEYEISLRGNNSEDTVLLKRDSYRIRDAKISNHRHGTDEWNVELMEYEEKSSLFSISSKEMRDLLPGNDTLYVDFYPNLNFVNWVNYSQQYNYRTVVYTWPVVVSEQAHLSNLMIRYSGIPNLNVTDTVTFKVAPEVDSTHYWDLWKDEFFVENSGLAPSPEVSLVLFNNDTISIDHMLCINDHLKGLERIKPTSFPLGINEYFNEVEKIFTVPSIPAGEVIRIKMEIPYRDSTRWYLAKLDAYNEAEEYNDLEEHKIRRLQSRLPEQPLRISNIHLKGDKSTGFNDFWDVEVGYQTEKFVDITDTLHCTFSVNTSTQYHATTDSIPINIRLLPQAVGQYPLREGLTYYDFSNAISIDTVMVPPLQDKYSSYWHDLYIVPAKYLSTGSGFKLQARILQDTNACFQNGEFQQIDFSTPPSYVIQKGGTGIGVSEISELPSTIKLCWPFEFSLNVINFEEEIPVDQPFQVHIEDDLGLLNEKLTIEGLPGAESDSVPGQKRIKRIISPTPTEIPMGEYFINLKITLYPPDGDPQIYYRAAKVSIENSEIEDTSLELPFVYGSQEKIMWEEVQDASYYQILIYDEEESIVDKQITENLSIVPQIDLKRDAQLTAYFRAFNRMCEFSERDTFSISYKYVEPVLAEEADQDDQPGGNDGGSSGSSGTENDPTLGYDLADQLVAPVILSPQNGSTNVLADRWNVIWENRSKKSYKVDFLFGTSQNNMKSYETKTASPYYLVNSFGYSSGFHWIEANKTYYLQLKAYDNEDTVYSSLVKFSTVDESSHSPKTPGIATIYNPSDNAVLKNCHAHFSFYPGQNPDGRFIRYTVEISKSPDMSQPATQDVWPGYVFSFDNVVNASNQKFLDEYTSYYWRLCSNDGNLSSCTEVRSFDYVANESAIKPIIENPVNGSNIQLSATNTNKGIDVDLRLGGMNRYKNLRGFGDPCYDDFTYEAYTMQSNSIVDNFTLDNLYINSSVEYYHRLKESLDFQRPISIFTKVTAKDGSVAYSDTVMFYVNIYQSPTGGGSSGGGTGDGSGGGSGGSTGGSSTCWENVTQKYVTQHEYDAERGKHKISFRNPYSYEVYFKYAFKKKSGGWESGSWYLQPGKTYSTYNIAEAKNCVVVLYMPDSERGSCSFPDESNFYCSN